MSGVLRLSNTAGGTGRSTVISEAIDDQTYILPVNGGVLITGGSSSELVFPSGTEASPGLQVQGDADTGLYSPAANTLAISTGANERLRIDSAGNVGIGESSPDRKLHVRNDGIYALKVGGESGAAFYLELGQPGASASPGINYTGTNASLRFLNNGSDVARFDGTGRLLIGTSTGNDSTAQSNLVIESNSTGATSYGGLMLRRGTTSISSGTSLGRMFFADQSGNVGARISGLGDGTWASNDYPGAITFDTVADGASALTERLRIDSSGRVGIGTDTPEQRLHVLTRGTLGGIIAQFENNDLDNFGGLRILGGITDRECRFQSLFGSSFFTFYTEGTGAAEERVRIDSSGVVKLTQTGNNPRFGSIEASGDAFKLKAFGNVANQFATMQFFTGDNSPVERMRIDSSGRLLVGTTTEGVGGGDQFTIGVTGNNNAGMTIRSGTSTRGAIYFSDGTSGAAEYDGYIEYDQADRYMRFGTGGGNQRLRINSNGISLFSSTQGAIQISTGVFTGNNTFVNITPWSNAGNLSGGGSILVLLHNHTGTTGGKSALHQIYINFNGALGGTSLILGGLSFDAEVNQGVLRFKSFDSGTGLSTTMGYSLIYSDTRLHTPD